MSETADERDRRHVVAYDIIRRETSRAMSSLRLAAEWAEEELECDGLFLAIQLRSHAEMIEKLRP